MVLKHALPLVLLAVTLVVSEKPVHPRVPQHRHAFDFWVGAWELTWNDSGKGTNTITREMDGHVIAEHFNDPAGHYSGSSWSVYDSTSDRWQQTWVDTQGGYIALTGGWDTDRMVLSTAPDPSGQRYKRMVFRDITPDAFDWDWMATTDGGATWKVEWHIRYERRK